MVDGAETGDAPNSALLLQASPRAAMRLRLHSRSPCELWMQGQREDGKFVDDQGQAREAEEWKMETRRKTVQLLFFFFCCYTLFPSSFRLRRVNSKSLCLTDVVLKLETPFNHVKEIVFPPPGYALADHFSLPLLSPHFLSFLSYIRCCGNHSLRSCIQCLIHT